MRILHFSDTHGKHNLLRDLPEADVIVHSGDFTMTGSQREAIDFISWFCDLPYPHKIFVSGNHDDCLWGAEIDGIDNNVHYLCNSGVEIDGVRFYGVPMFMRDCVTDCQKHNYEKIPANTDVLITHAPPYGILDFDAGVNYGSEELLVRISDINPKAHLFGHIHAQHGIAELNDTIFSNGSMLTADYSVLNTPNIIDLPQWP